MGADEPSWHWQVLLSLRLIGATCLLRTMFDPDEFFQTLDPAYCLYERTSLWLGGGGGGKPPASCDHLTWEWRRGELTPASFSDSIDRLFDGPYRSFVPTLPYTFVYLLLGIAAASVPRALLPAPPYSLFVFGSKCLSGILAYFSDHLILSIYSLLSSKPTTSPSDLHCIVLCLSSSWFMLYCGCRSYANSFEMLGGLLGLRFLLFPSSKTSPASKAPPTSSPLPLYVLSGVLVSVRFTALFFWAPLVACHAVLLAVQSHIASCERSSHRRVLIGCIENRPTSDTESILPPARKVAEILISFLRTSRFVPCFVFGLVLSYVIDCLCSDIPNSFPPSFINSFYFNAVKGKSSLYGVHPSHWYLSSCLPAIAGTNLPFMLMHYFSGSRRLSSPLSSPSHLQWFSLRVILLSYVLAHSISPHKELRFMLPVMPIVVLEAAAGMANIVKGQGVAAERENNTTRPVEEGRTMVGRRSASPLPIFCVVKIVANLLAVLFLGQLWQGGGVKAAISAASILSSSPSSSRLAGITAQDERSSRMLLHHIAPCHSVPAHPYLHGVGNVYVRALDCGPACRDDPSVTCESDAFTSDEYGFVVREYAGTGGRSVRENDLVVPDVVVQHSGKGLEGEKLLADFFVERMGLVLVDTFWHTFDERFMVFAKAEHLVDWNMSMELAKEEANKRLIGACRAALCLYEEL